MGGVIGELQLFYQDFLTVDAGKLGQIYDQSVVFSDPIHRVEGLDALQAYFEAVSQGLASCRFEFENAVEGAGSACLPWVMHYAHRALNGGQPMTLRGCSLLRFGEKIHYHEDFYDMGAMVYEHVPLLGAVVRRIKSRMAPGAG
ncbi:nuclear transport factor 2 family protein [Microbulbifer yueqingensis]|uniref:SnoaL-like domain-containing protein n=1 Tax=Microbulbifer yueqingensis TaxID=658219 RepID=A0A1G8ZAG0_9GAMM|nr:nuclear transport factor 2 family protein [Microbulbifer yueqingensis]SDK12041.1 SnoaL-like domain-containing protein [Microbulbifer yueqingensis]